MKNYTVVPNRISSLFSPNDLYTLIGLYFTTNSNYSAENGAYPPTQNGLIHPQLLLKWP